MTKLITARLRRTMKLLDAAFGKVGLVPINPDGPEAADLIDTQDAKIKALESELGQWKHAVGHKPRTENNMLTADEKIEFHNKIKEIKKLVTEMNGPFWETKQILIQLNCLREAWIDDEIEKCDFCGSEHLFSESNIVITEEGQACDLCIAAEKETT